MGPKTGHGSPRSEILATPLCMAVREWKQAQTSHGRHSATKRGSPGIQQPNATTSRHSATKRRRPGIHQLQNQCLFVFAVCAHRLRVNGMNGEQQRRQKTAHVRHEQGAESETGQTHSHRAVTARPLCGNQVEHSGLKKCSPAELPMT